MSVNNTSTCDKAPAHSTGRKRPVLNEHRIKKDRWLKYRLGAQAGFAILVVWIGWEFVTFVSALRSGSPVPMTDRPPGIEGFLPISSFMELWLWIKSGVAPAVHPAGVVIIGFALGTALLMRKGFCSWLCPVGTLSESLSRLGSRLGVQWKPPRWLDIPLRGIKYLFLAFFLYVILGMGSAALASFITGDYNLVSDIKMLDYFSPPSRLTWSVVGILALATLVLRNFWCRYACPYGALLGLVSRVSPLAIRRDSVTCIDCDLCTKVCPSYLPVATAQSIRSEECLACHQCIAVCPVKDCLQFSTPKKKFHLSPQWYGIGFLILFLASVGVARLTGYWYSSIPGETYRELSRRTETLTHPRNAGGFAQEKSENH